MTPGFAQTKLGVAPVSRPPATTDYFPEDVYRPKKVAT